MAVHVSFRSELHSAELALVWLDPKVDIEVHLQVFLHGEALGTNVALVWTKVFRRVLGHLMVLQQLLWKSYISYICFLAVVRNVHCLFYMGLVGHSKSNLETRIPDFCLMGAKYF